MSDLQTFVDDTELRDAVEGDLAHRELCLSNEVDLQLLAVRLPLAHLQELDINELVLVATAEAVHRNAELLPLDTLVLVVALELGRMHRHEVLGIASAVQHKSKLSSCAAYFSVPFVSKPYAWIFISTLLLFSTISSGCTRIHAPRAVSFFWICALRVTRRPTFPSSPSTFCCALARGYPVGRTPPRLRGSKICTLAYVLVLRDVDILPEVVHV